MGRDHVEDPGVLTPHVMKWCHGVVTRSRCHGVMTLYGTMEAVKRSGAKGSNVALYETYPELWNP